MKYFSDARERARRRKSPWNLILLPFCFGGIIAVALVQFKAIWFFHSIIYPEHAARDFWQQRIDIRSALLSTVMLVAPLPGAFPLGLMLGNRLARLIPPMRRALDDESRNVPGSDYQAAQKGLWRIAVWPVSIGWVAALGAAIFLDKIK